MDFLEIIKYFFIITICLFVIVSIGTFLLYLTGLYIVFLLDLFDKIKTELSTYNIKIILKYLKIKKR